MADEKHDLLDHTQVAGICLLCLNVKSQPVEYEVNYEENSGAIYDDSYPIKNEPMNCDTEQTEHPISMTYVTSQTIPQNKTAHVQIENLQNRIILGKKPCSRYKPEPQRKTLFIMLEDWGERLKTSPCYCKECQTLFVTRNDIDAHNMAAHSFLVPVEKPQTPESSPVTEDSPPLNQRKMVRLMLEDCGENLHTSPSFCKECQTLFVTTNAIDAHNMAAHSFLVPVVNTQTSESPPKKDNNTPLNQPNMVRLMLEDCGEILNTSPCFCKECQTLFATRNAMDAHNMAEHFFLAPVENIQTPESPPQKKDSPPPNQPNHTNCNTHLAPKKSIENNFRMKHKMLKPTCNFLYVCESCDVTTDSYNDVIDHCQNHYNDMQSLDVTIKNCDQCSLKFEEKCYTKHQELHSNQDIDRSSFTILKYDYTKLLTDAWFEVFNSLPSEKMMQILKRSIYATRLVKMKLLQSGPPEYTIYKCQKCEEIVARDKISIHTTEARSCRKQPPKHTCMHCGLAFANTRALDAHISIHDQHTVTVNSFRIVAFNHSDEIAFNAKLRSECSISENLPQQNIANTPEDRYKCIYYRCEKCYCSTSKLCDTVRHVCPVERDTRLCHTCNNVFHYNGIISHNRKHDKTGMIGDDIVIKPFNANIKPGEWRVDLYECENCKTKFPTHLLNTHQCRSKATNKIRLTLYRCKTCKELFSIKENLEKHSKSCHKGRRKCIFKCRKCSRFMLSRAAMQYHTSEDSEDKTVIKPCKYCGWKFTPWSLHKHIKLHHQSLKLTPKDFCIEVIDTHCGALDNVNKKNQKQLTNVPKEASVKSNTCNMKPAITTHKSRKERLMDRTHKKETKTEKDEADIKINVNKGIEEEQKVEQKKSIESNKKSTYNTIQYDKMKNTDSELSLVEDSSVDQTKNKKLLPQPDETVPQPKKSPPTLNYAATKKYTYKIYKCGQCNVYFMAQYTCYIHMLRHTPIEAKEFIECKLCNLPFKVVSLNTHMRKHHKENFNLDEVLVEEYTNDGGKTPKIEIYYAIDKVQSRLVSTTSDEPSLERYIESNSQPSSSCSNAQTNDDVVETSQADTSDAAMDAQPSISLETVDDNTDTNSDVVEISQANTSDAAMDAQPSISLETVDDNTDTNSDVVEISQADASDAAMDAQPSISLETVDDITDTNSDVVEISQADTSSDVTISIQPSDTDGSDDDNTDEIEDISLIDKEETTNDDVEETSQSDTSSDVTVNMNLEPSVISVSSESDDDNTDEIEDINSIKKECQFCGEKFKSNISKKFHERLDHLDGEKNCLICDQTFNASILNALHLDIKNNTFECCLCTERFDVQNIANHAILHLV